MARFWVRKEGIVNLDHVVHAYYEPSGTVSLVMSNGWKMQLAFSEYQELVAYLIEEEGEEEDGEDGVPEIDGDAPEDCDSGGAENGEDDPDEWHH